MNVVKFNCSANVSFDLLFPMNMENPDPTDVEYAVQEHLYQQLSYPIQGLYSTSNIRVENLFVEDIQ